MPLAIGSRRELFIDDALVERLSGKAEQRLQQPQPRELALTHDAPWEGTAAAITACFAMVIAIALFYKAWHLDASSGKLRTDSHPLFLCTAESDDGIVWRNRVGFARFSRLKGEQHRCGPAGQFGEVKADPGHAAVFKDDNPAATADARYKAIFARVVREACCLSNRLTVYSGRP